MLNRRGFISLTAAGLVFPAPAARASSPLTRYTYKDTQRLVALVEDAAALIETEGEAAFTEFGVKGSRWLNGSTYLFVYDQDGNTMFHPISPELVGKNVADLRDIDGKLVVQEVIDVAKDPDRTASGWVFYRWQDQRQLTPIWKSSYVRKAVSPQGKVYLVGCGLYDIKVERSFIEDRVNLACDLLMKEGKARAFAEITDSSSRFVFLDTYIFVLNEAGDTLVDPAFPTRGGRHMLDFRDFNGFQPIRELLGKLKTHDTAWVQFLWPKPGATLPSRKLIYGRKVILDGEVLIVGADLYLATPIWMRVETSQSWPRSLPA
jgi:signal transduction histidine kinase